MENVVVFFLVFIICLFILNEIDVITRLSFREALAAIFGNIFFFLIVYFIYYLITQKIK